MSKTNEILEIHDDHINSLIKDVKSCEAAIFELKRHVKDLRQSVEQLQQQSSTANYVIKIPRPEVGTDNSIKHSEGWGEIEKKEIIRNDIEGIIEQIESEGFFGTNEFTLHLRDEIVAYIMKREAK